MWTVLIATGLAITAKLFESRRLRKICIFKRERPLEFILQLLIQSHASGFSLSHINLMSVCPFSVSRVLALKDTTVTDPFALAHSTHQSVQSQNCAV